MEYKGFWNNRRSLRLSRLLVWAFAAALAVCDVCGPALVRFMVSLVTIQHGEPGIWALLICLYLGSVPGFVLLWQLNKLLAALENGEVFIADNVKRLRAASHCCAAAALICLACAFEWPFLLLVTVAAGFVSLIIRVVKNVFEQAILMKDELDYTV